MRMLDRIEEECIRQVSEFKLPSKVYLGKKEAAQLNKEAGFDRIVLAEPKCNNTVQIKSISEGAIEVIETELESEFRME